MVGPASQAMSSGIVALVLILFLTFAVVAYIVIAPAPTASRPLTSQLTGSESVQTTASITGLATTTTTSRPSPATAAVSSATTTSSSTTLVSSSHNQTSNNLILEGGMSGSQKPGGTFDAPLNSSTQAETTWSAPGPVTIYLYNSTGALVFSKSGSPGNYTFCVPATGTYTEELHAYGSKVGQWNVYLYEIRGSSCTPPG